MLDITLAQAHGAISSHEQELIALRRHLHAHPELSHHEHQTTALLAEDAPGITPKFVLLSSAAVTRPEWREEQRETFAEAYGIPIVGLNPGGILGFKLKGERVSGEAPEHEAGGGVREVAGEMLRAALPSGREGRVWGLPFARLH